MKETRTFLKRGFLRACAVVLALSIVLAMSGIKIFAASEPKAAKLVAAADGDNFVTTVSLTPGATYLFSLYYKSETKVDGAITVQYETDAAHTVQPIAGITSAREVEYYKYTYTFTVPGDGYKIGSAPNQTTPVLLAVNMGLTGNISRIYDLSLKKSGSEDNLIKYPTFTKNFSSYYVYDKNFTYSTRVAGTKTVATMGGCSLETPDTEYYVTPPDDRWVGKMVKMTSPFYNSAFCTTAQLTPGETYCFSVFLKSDLSYKDMMGIYYKNDGSYTALKSVMSDISDSYRRYSAEFTVPDVGAETTEILMSITLGKPDVVSYIYAPMLWNTADEKQTNLLPNSYFENSFTGYRLDDAKHTKIVECPTTGDVFTYVDGKWTYDCPLQTLDMTVFEKPAAYVGNRMMSISDMSAAGWFLIPATVERDKTYDVSLYLRLTYMPDGEILGIFYEDADGNVQQLDGMAALEEDSELHFYRTSFTPTDGNCYFYNGKATIYLGISQAFSVNNVPNAVYSNGAYVYEPVIREQGVEEAENVVRDPYFNRNFTYRYTVNGKLERFKYGTMDNSVWGSFALEDYDETVFQKTTGKKMAVLKCPWWSAYFVNRASCVAGKTYVYELDYQTDADIDEPIRLYYDFDDHYGTYMTRITEVTVTEDANVDHFYYEFTVPTDGKIAAGEPATVYISIVMGEVGAVVNVANWALTEKGDETAENLLYCKDLSSNYYGIRMYNNELNNCSLGQSASTEWSGSKIEDYDAQIFVKSESSRIIGTDWALPFNNGVLRVKKNKKMAEIGTADDEETTSAESTPVTEEIIEEIEETEEYEEIEETEEYEEYEEYEEEAEEPEETEEVTGKKAKNTVMRKKKIITVVEEADYTVLIVCIVAGVVLVGGGAAAFFIIRKKRAKKAK